MVFQWYLLQRSRLTQACTRTYQATKQTCILVRQTLNPPTEILTTYSDQWLQRKKQKKIKIKNSIARIKKRQQQNNSSLEEKEKKDKTKHATTNNSSSRIFYVCAVHTQVLAFMATASCCSCSSCSKQPEVPKMTMRRMQLYIHVFLTTEWLQIPEACVCARECYSRFSSEYLYVRGRESKFSVYSVKSGDESVCSFFFVSLLVCA